jgi:cell division protein FtsL
MPAPARARTRPAPAPLSRPAPAARTRLAPVGTLQAAATALAADRDPSFVVAEPVRRPRLRVVDEAARRDQLARQRRARLLVAVVVTVVVGSVFALAAAHAYLVSGQGRLDRLTAEVEQARATYSENRLEVAQLGSPERITSEAINRLGMVTPDATHYLSPSSQLAAQVGAIAPGATTSEAAGAPWSAVKPYLGASK